MVSPQHIDAVDTLTREVGFVLEVVDPVAATVVSAGLTVQARGLARAPIVNLSGRFVWQAEGEAWPTALHVDPGTLPFRPLLVPAPPRPFDLATASAADRLLRVALRPTAAYPFDTGVTAVRGLLREAPPNLLRAGLRVQLAFLDERSGRWLPAPPAALVAPPDVRSPSELEVDAQGGFCAFLRLVSQRVVQPDVVDGQLRARLQFTAADGSVTRVTPSDFAFSPGAPTGRLREGLLLRHPLTLRWDRLDAL